MTREEFDTFALPLIEVPKRWSARRKMMVTALVFVSIEDIAADEPSLDLLAASALDWAIGEERKIMG